MSKKSKSANPSPPEEFTKLTPCDVPKSLKGYPTSLEEQKDKKRNPKGFDFWVSAKKAAPEVTRIYKHDKENPKGKHWFAISSRILSSSPEPTTETEDRRPSELVPAEYNGQVREIRTRDKSLEVMLTVGGEPLVEWKGSKWLELKEWASEMFTKYELLHNQFITIHALLHQVSHVKVGKKHLSEEEVLKASQRIAAIFQPEWEMECEQRRRDHALRVFQEPTTKTVKASEIVTSTSAPKEPKKKGGVIKKIIELLKDATKKKPVTRETILKELVLEFPDRAESAMRSTISSQVPNGLFKEKKIKVHTNDKGGYWI